MALLNTAALRRDLIQSGTWGNVSAVSGSYTCTTAELGTDSIAVVKVPANSEVIGLVYSIGEAGLAVWDIGYIAADDATDVNATAWATDVADAAANQSLFTAVPTALGDSIGGYYITFTPSAAVTAAGVISVTVLYKYNGYEA